jgi:hypothetical protein
MATANFDGYIAVFNSSRGEGGNLNMYEWDGSFRECKRQGLKIVSERMKASHGRVEWFFTLFGAVYVDMTSAAERRVGFQPNFNLVPVKAVFHV